jgi:hypothetical protein
LEVALCVVSRRGITFTLVFTNGNAFSPALSDQNGDGKPDGRNP